MVESGSTASKAIKPGDILVKINAHDVTDRDSARKVCLCFFVLIVFGELLEMNWFFSVFRRSWNLSTRLRR